MVLVHPRLPGKEPDDVDGSTRRAVPTPVREKVERLARDALAGLPARDADLFAARLRRWWPDLAEGLAGPYGADHDLEAFLERMAVLLAERYRDRPEELKLLDLERGIRTDWLQDPSMLGYVAYSDRFAGTLEGVGEHLDYLADLGVRYLHLMPLLAPREGDSDGGYAVRDYLAVDPRLGGMDDLEKLAARLRTRGISLCIDLVLNHTAAEHDWAVRARAGDPDAEAMYWTFPDRAMPDAYERTLPEVFPDFAPGNFTWVPELGKWMWTTFNAFQWDLNWSNPSVFAELTDVLLHLANRGVEVFRLDAVAFIWKRLGTNCQNQPEVHDLLQALRACARIVAPSVAFKAEAIVSPSELVFYLGVGRHHGRVSDLAYHNSLMVQFWSALATRDTRLATMVLGRFPAKPASTAWATYLRCHDDIGWAIMDDDAAAVGWNGWQHKRFLADFYAGAFPGSFARGMVFQDNPVTGDRRTSGTLASMAGLEQALEAGDPALVDMALRRILLGHALIFGWDGVPLLYMGDELGLRNDHSFLDDPDLAGDNRWLHRPRMDWAAAGRREQPGTVEHRLFTGLRALAEARRRTPHLHAATPAEVVDLHQPRLLAFVRRHPLGPLLAIHNLTETHQPTGSDGLGLVGHGQPVDRISGQAVQLGWEGLWLEPYQAVWLTAPDQPPGTP
jgi:amylosucrase